MKKIILLMLISIYTYADYFTKYVWYNEEVSLSKITITLEELRGDKSVDYFLDNKIKFQNENKFLTRDYANRSKRTFTKNVNMSGHSIKTIIEITPPTSHGLDGSLAHTIVTIIFDGIQRLKVPLGSYYGNNSIPKIIIYADDMSIEAYIVDYSNDKYIFFDKNRLNETLIFKNDKLIINKIGK